MIKDKIKMGMDMLSIAFPDFEVRTFIPPFDALSKIALKILVYNNYNICTMSNNFPLSSSVNPYDYKGSFLFKCDNYFFNPSFTNDSAEDCYRFAYEILNKYIGEDSLLVIGNHYWEFYHDWMGVNVDLTIYWNLFVDSLLSIKKMNLQLSTE
jgi:hypothetical protein